MDTGLRFGATRLPKLSDRSGITMGRLRYAFEKQKMGSKLFDGRYLVIKLMVDNIFTLDSGTPDFNN